LNNYRSSILLVVLIVLLSISLIGLTLANYRYASQNPGGNDFLPRWLGTRLFLLEAQSPYSQQTTEAIQQMTYGRLADQGEDQVLFVYPFYSIFVFAPFAIIKDFSLARAVWMTVLEVSVVALGMVGLNLTHWRIPKLLLVLLLLFIALWYHSVRPVINGNASVICALFIGLAFIAIRTDHDILAAILLALSAIKPQMVVLLVIFVLLWSANHQRWSLFWGFLTSLGFLVALTSLLIPNWIVQNLRQILSYPEYTLPGTPGAIFAAWLPGVGSQMGWVLTVFMAGILFWEWRAALDKDFNWFFWTASLTLVITNLIGIRTATANYIALLPALILVFATWDERWRGVGRWLVIASMLLLFFGLWALFLNTLQSGEQPTQSPIMFFPLPLFLIIGLYWIRWWATHPPRVFLEEMRSFQNRRTG